MLDPLIKVAPAGYDQHKSSGFRVLFSAANLKIPNDILLEKEDDTYCAVFWF